MDDWEKFNKIPLPEKKNFNSHLNMEDITDRDYALAKRFCKDIEMKNLGEYRNLYVQGNALLSADMLKLILGPWRIMIKIKNCHIFNIGM